MNPLFYEALGNRLISRKWYLLLVAILSVILVAGSQYLSVLMGASSPWAAISRVGALFLIVFWGVFLAVLWFSDGGPMSSTKLQKLNGVRQSLNKLQSWAAAVFLTLWFVLGVGFSIFSIARLNA